MSVHHPCNDDTRNNIIESIASQLLSQKTRGSFLHEKFKKLVSESSAQAFVSSIDYIDTGYDQSFFGRKSSNPIDKSKFQTINDFLVYPTGDSIPTFCSGHGMVAEIWEDRITDNWREIVVNQYNAIPEYQSVLSAKSWTDYQGNLITDDSEIVEDIDQALCDHIIDTELMEAWRHDPLP